MKSHQRRSVQSKAFRVFAEALESRTLLSTIIVNSTLDMPMPPVPMVTLRKAVALANVATSPTTITFSPSVFSSHKTITLTHGGLILTNTSHATTITGPSVGVTVSGDKLGGVFFDSAKVHATLSRMILTQGTGFVISGSSFTSGGAVEDAGGTMTLNDVAVTASASTNNGGGIYNTGTMTLNNSTVSGNSASEGGGIENDGTMTLRNVIVAKNNSGGGGGGIGNHGTVTVNDSTVARNTGTFASGIDNESGSITLTNSTVFGNSTQEDGGGIFNEATVTLRDVTISGNSAANGGGIDNSAGTMTLSNTIVAGNKVITSNPDARGTIHSLGHNLIRIINGSTGWIASDLTGTAAQPLNADLGALGNNGGPTPTMLPQTGSPAINAGSNSLIPSGVTTDQRGLPRISGGTVDIGAVEVQQKITLPGTVFFDVNKNGKQDPGDAGLAGWKVYDDIGNKGHFVSGDPFTFTNSTGAYGISVPFTGDAILRQVVPANFTQTAPKSNAGYTVAITASSAKQKFNFGDFTSVKYLKTVATSPGIVAWWTFNSPTRTEPPPDPDSILNGYTGTLEGGAKLTAAGKGAPINGESNNTGLSLNGTSAFLKTNLTTQQEFASAGTFNVWINLIPAVQHTETILSKSQTNNALELAIETDGSVHFLTDHTTTASFRPASLSGWHMVTAEFNTSSKLERIFWDGKQVASATPGKQSPSTAGLTIGASDVASGRFFGGSIDEATLWNLALPGSEITAIYNASKG